MLQFHPQVKIWVVGDKVFLDEANTRLLWVARPCEHRREELLKGLLCTGTCLLCALLAPFSSFFLSRLALPNLEGATEALLLCPGHGLLQDHLWQIRMITHDHAA